MQPDALRDLARGDKYVYEDIDHAFAKDGTDLLIYHNTVETLTLKYYSKFLVATVTTGVAKETPNAAGTSADTFRIDNDNLIIQRVLMYLYQREPNSENDYLVAKQTYEATLKAEKLLNPSQAMERLEPIEFIG